MSRVGNYTKVSSAYNKECDGFDDIDNSIILK